MTRVVFREHPAIEFPQCLIARGFADQSWHNDAAARTWLKMRNGITVHVWCAEENVEDREMASAGQRFMVSIGLSEAFEDDDLNRMHFIGECETVDELETILRGACIDDPETDAVKYLIDAEAFARMAGREPMHDDLDRVNCARAGAVGHYCCGVCSVHTQPRFECGCIRIAEVQS